MPGTENIGNYPIFSTEKWFLENPRDGLLQKRPYMEGIPFIDVDYCQFSDWGYCKPTRVWGGHISQLTNHKCVKGNCANVVVPPTGRPFHRER